ncbi:lysoplasmalogenase [Metapseudomonas otitidis]|uniref:Membrane protein n=1 Tax=Metapseudomonas otitidis TaxID=319939 RepID=A0A679GNP5_9GAMM|nr:lysoplasmalogenase [Pseudomonas otitidis]BCA27634.1 membrane protein [Pseudomonas otitidis]
MPALLIGLTGACAFLIGRALDLPWLCFASKPLPVIALMFWLRCAPAGAYRNRVALGLALCLLGDVLLQWPGDLFVPGLAAFLLGHLCYIAAYLSDSRRLAPLALVACLVYGGAMFALLGSGGLGPLALPVALYALTISTMLWRALARIGETGIARGSVLAAVAGALCFVVSDSLLGIARFVGSFPGDGYAIILSYWLGQWGITASARFKAGTACNPT